MRKRVSRACDECRLHKARCDGINPCETCQRYDRECSYDLLPIECKGPAARIRILENRLIKANECITRLKKQGPCDNNVNVVQSSILSTKSETIETHGPQPGTHTNLQTETQSNVDTGDPIIISLLRPLAYDIGIEALIAESRRAGSLLLDHTNLGREKTTSGFCQLPEYDTTLEHIYMAFNNTFGLYSVVMEQPFRIATQRLYDLNPISRTQQDIEFMPLFHAVLALGMIHQDSGYEDVVHQSLPYFEAAAFTILNNDECSTVPKLQLRVCLVLYHLSLSRLNLARPMFQVICASSIVHNLLQSVTTHGFEELHTSESRARDIIWTIFFLDMHIASLTQIPALLGTPGPEIATVYAINTAAYNVANYKRSSSAFLLSVSIAMAIELIKLIRRISPPRVSGTPQPHLALSSTPNALVERHGWNKVRTELQTWDYMLQNIFPEHEVNCQISLAGSELRLHHCLAEIMLYHNFLECLAESTATGAHYEIDDIKNGRACVSAATNAISHLSNRLAQIPATNLTWSSAYTIFISSLTLLVAAAFTHAAERHTIHGTVYVAIQILQNTTYGSSRCKESYLGFIQALSERVMMTFNIASTYEHTLSAENSATCSNATTDWSASWCNSSPHDVPDLAGLQSWQIGAHGGFWEEWGFDSGE